MSVEVERRSHVAVVTLAWPEKRNSLGVKEARELLAALQACAGDETIRGLVLTGRGAFCSGGDLKELVKLADKDPETLSAEIYGTFQGITRALLGMPFPTAAAIDGAAIGAGFDYALACDMRFVGETGWVMQGWARVGLVPGTGGIHLLASIAPQLAVELASTQDRLGPAAIESQGLGRRVPAGRSAVDAAVEALRGLASLPAEASRGYAELCRQSRVGGLDEHLESCRQLQVSLLTSEEFRRRAEAVLRPEEIEA